MEPTLPPDTQHDLKSILEHVRGQFQYHAGQRLNAIRYFFVAYAIFVAAYVGAMGTQYAGVPSYVQLVLSASGLLVTLGFWGLDKRNVKMVHIDEAALKEIERLVALKYNFKDFEMTQKWDEAAARSILTYQNITNVLFGAIALMSAAAVLRDLCRVFGRT